MLRLRVSECVFVCESAARRFFLSATSSHKLYVYFYFFRTLFVIKSRKTKRCKRRHRGNRKWDEKNDRMIFFPIFFVQKNKIFVVKNRGNILNSVMLGDSAQEVLVRLHGKLFYRKVVDRRWWKSKTCTCYAPHTPAKCVKSNIEMRRIVIKIYSSTVFNYPHRTHAQTTEHPE